MEEQKHSKIPSNPSLYKRSYEPRSDNRDPLAIKVKSEILAVVNIYRKFEQIIFTNNKDMSV